MKVEYVILINWQQDAEGRYTSFMDGYKPGDRLMSAWAGEIELPPIEQEPIVNISHLDICEQLFEIFNINFPEGYRNRSLSVGDVVRLKIERNVYYFAVDHIGFKQVEVPE